MKLKESFYQRSRVDSIAKDLLGKVLVSCFNNSLTSGIIVETEAYSYKERGCHAYNNLRTARTETLFGEGGIMYVYLCYGIHNMFNVVTNRKNKAEAVLIRALEPLQGMEIMMERTSVEKVHRITSGPGKLTKALGIGRAMDGEVLTGSDIWIEDSGTKIARNKIVVTKRIGIDYAGEDAFLPWRFYLKDNLWISRP
ncbi:MAG: DNA-3-methyladenine glycosylase [Cyclobacteriaceae bacterium]|nr:DNA-3-methyladenine glycosylase [Cyclobacteriaceae bacterium]